MTWAPCKLNLERAWERVFNAINLVNNTLKRDFGRFVVQGVWRAWRAEKRICEYAVYKGGGVDMHAELDGVDK